VFNPAHPIYTRIRQLADARRLYKPLRRGRQYRRETSRDGRSFHFLGSGELLAWSRVFDDQEVLVVVNTNGVETRSGQVIIDRRLSWEEGNPRNGLKVVCNTDPGAPAALAANAIVPFGESGPYTFVDVETLHPTEVLVLVSRTAEEAAGRVW
jgi:hypothetical protein